MRCFYFDCLRTRKLIVLLFFMDCRKRTANSGFCITEIWILEENKWGFCFLRENKMVKEIDRKEQQILGGVLVKDLRSLVIARKEGQLRGTKLFYSEAGPGPSTSRAQRIEKTRMGLRVYGKGVNRNKLVAHTMYSPSNHRDPSKENVQKNFFGLYNWICKFNRPKKIGMLILWFISTAVVFWILKNM